MAILGSVACADPELIASSDTDIRKELVDPSFEEHIEPMRAKLMWGYDYPYMVTGLLNQHPRAGMAFNSSKDRGKIVQFYDQMEEDE